MTMNIKTKLIISAALVALLSAPASARIDGDEGGASAFPRFTKERQMTGSGFVSPSAHLVNRPFHQR
jgi:hypothetical protein